MHADRVEAGLDELDGVRRRDGVQIGGVSRQPGQRSPAQPDRARLGVDDAGEGGEVERVVRAPHAQQCVECRRVDDASPHQPAGGDLPMVLDRRVKGCFATNKNRVTANYWTHVSRFGWQPVEPMQTPIPPHTHTNNGITFLITNLNKNTALLHTHSCVCARASRPHYNLWVSHARTVGLPEVASQVKPYTDPTSLKRKQRHTDREKLAQLDKHTPRERENICVTLRSTLVNNESHSKHE